MTPSVLPEIRSPLTMTGPHKRLVTMNGILIRPDSPAWSMALDAMPHDIYHLPGYACAAGSSEHALPCAFHYEHDGSRFLLPILLREIPESLDPRPGGSRDAISPYGYPGPMVVTRAGANAAAFVREAMTRYLDVMHEHAVVTSFIRSHPILSPPASHFSEHGETVTHGRTVSIDLGQTKEEIWSGYRHNHRRDINKARRRGVTARIDEQWERLDDFVDIYHDTMNRLDATNSYYFSRAYFDSLRRSLDGHVVLCVVEQEGELLCAGMFSEYQGIVQYMLSGSTAHGLKVRAAKTMMHFVQEWARERGNRYLHLGGGLGGNEDALFNFKAGFGTTLHPFWTWRAVVKTEHYRHLVEARHPARTVTRPSVNGFFPEYRSP